MAQPRPNSQSRLPNLSTDQDMVTTQDKSNPRAESCGGGKCSNTGGGSGRGWGSRTQWLILTKFHKHWSWRQDTAAEEPTYFPTEFNTVDYTPGLGGASLGYQPLWSFKPIQGSTIGYHVTFHGSTATSNAPDWIIVMIWSSATLQTPSNSG